MKVYCKQGCRCAYGSVTDMIILMQGEDDEDDEEQPLSLAWPETRQKQAMYLFIFPIVFPLWLTLPDVRRDVRSSCSIPVFPSCIALS